MRKNRGIRALKFTAIAIVGIAVFGFIVMSLWNWLMPSLFGLRTITFWQAWGILILAKILFGSFGGRTYRGRHWRHRMMERWEHMPQGAGTVPGGDEGAVREAAGRSKSPSYRAGALTWYTPISRREPPSRPKMRSW
jgi:hypothetical protein